MYSFKELIIIKNNLKTNIVLRLFKTMKNQQHCVPGLNRDLLWNSWWLRSEKPCKSVMHAAKHVLVIKKKNVYKLAEPGLTTTSLNQKDSPQRGNTQTLW